MKRPGLLLGLLLFIGLPALAGSRKRSLWHMPTSGGTLRMDVHGDGRFGAKRGERFHRGLDITVTAGAPVYSPIEGVVVREARPYVEGPLSGLLIQGTGKHAGLQVKMFYLSPIAPGTILKPGSFIGTAQSVSAHYGLPDMKDHVHIEVFQAGVRIDPYPFFFK